MALIDFLPLGGADSVGASCFYCNINGTGILLDCGINPQKYGADSLPDFNLITDLPADILLISHAHQDHIGALPFLIKRHPYLKIYATVQTKEIADLTLHNAVKIVESQLLDDPVFKPYSYDDITLLIKSITGIEYCETLEMTGLRHSSGEPVKISFYDAGHILGSAGILIEYDNKKLFYTGDIKLSDQTIMKGAKLPAGRVDTLILECTYGNTDSAGIMNWDEESKKMSGTINKIINRGGSILIPVFSLGKLQEIFLKLTMMMRKGILTEIPIFTGGLGNSISRIYDSNRFIVDRNLKNEELQKCPQLNYKDISDLNYFVKNPSIVMASSGMMLPSTSSYNMAKFWIREKSFAIVIVGYMDPNSPGGLIAASKKGDKIKLECEIKKFHFPSHAKREELLTVVDNLKPDQVVLVHGDEKAKDYIGHQLLKKYPRIKLFSALEGKSLKL